MNKVDLEQSWKELKVQINELQKELKAEKSIRVEKDAQLKLISAREKSLKDAIKTFASIKYPESSLGFGSYNSVYDNFGQAQEENPRFRRRQGPGESHQRP